MSDVFYYTLRINKKTGIAVVLVYDTYKEQDMELFDFVRIKYNNNNNSNYKFSIVSLEDIDNEIKDLVFWQNKMENACTQLFITTDDGSLGTKGFVTQILAEIMEKEKPFIELGDVVQTDSIAKVPDEKIEQDNIKGKSLYPENTIESE